jgi:hypothetical protein
MRSLCLNVTTNNIRKYTLYVIDHKFRVQIQPRRTALHPACTQSKRITSQTQTTSAPRMAKLQNKPPELILLLVPLVGCVGFAEVVEVGEPVDPLVEVAFPPFFKGANPTVPFAKL